MTDYTDLIERLRGNDMPWSVKDAADALEAQAGRIAELEKMLAVHRLAVDVDALKARIAELEAENERFLNMLTKFANANSDICEVVKNGGSDSEAMRIFFVHLTDMMDDIMKLRAELGKE
jgi:uncharacterized protein YdcH (DUF465 family)